MEHLKESGDTRNVEVFLVNIWTWEDLKGQWDGIVRDFDAKIAQQHKFLIV